MKIINYFKLLTVLFCWQSLFSNNKDSLILKEFELNLNTNKYDEFQDDRITFNSYKFYSNKYLDSLNTSEFYKSGGGCFSKLYSKKIILLREIFKIFKGIDSNMPILLRDSSTYDKKFDLLVKFCGSDDDFGKIINKDTTMVNNLIKSYQDWFILLNKKGLNYLREFNILPTFQTNYFWTKEKEYVSNSSENRIIDIINTAKLMLEDSNYSKKFISENNLDKEKNSWKNIILKCTILGVLNTFDKYNLIYTNSEIKLGNLNSSNFDLFINELHNCKSIYDLLYIYSKFKIEIYSKVFLSD